MRGLVAVVSQTKLMKDGLFWTSESEVLYQCRNNHWRCKYKSYDSYWMTHTVWVIPTLKKIMAFQTSVQLQKFWIKPGLHRTVSKRTIEPGNHAPFSLRTARSELVRNYLNLFRLVRPEVSNSELLLVRNGSIFPTDIFRWLIWSWTDRFWSLDPWSRTFMIMIMFIV